MEAFAGIAMEENKHFLELLPAYALDCLDEEETVQVSQHLVTCELCRLELLSYQKIVDELPLAVQQVDLPQSLKDKIMRRIGGKTESGTLQPQASWWGSSILWMRRTAPAWGLVSLMLVALLLTSNLFLWKQTSELRGAKPGEMRVVVLAGTEFAPDATGTVIISRSGESGTLVVDGLAPLNQSQTYQLWLIKNGQRTSGGVFSVYQSGYGRLGIYAPQPLGSYDAFGITIEPAGGSPGPTGNKVLGGEL